MFDALHRHQVLLEGMVLKPSMVLPGKETPPKAAPEVVARATLEVLKRNVPAAVPTINFLSGGQAPVEATANLNAMNVLARTRRGCCRFPMRARCRTARCACGRVAPKTCAPHRMRSSRGSKMNSLARAGTWSEALEK